jgi:hypothetical protein
MLIKTHTHLFHPIEWVKGPPLIVVFWAAHRLAALHAGHVFSALAMVYRTRSASSRPGLRARLRLPRIVVATAICEALLSASFASEPPGAGERQKQVFTQPRTSPERTYEIFGHPLGLRKRPEGRCACLRPQAEFARASERSP